MASSPVALSPRPNPPGSSSHAGSLHLKAKALAIHSNRNARSPAITAASTPSDSSGGQDLAEQMNDEVRRQFVTGARLGEGTYAVVYAGHYRSDPTALVAIKKMKLNADFKDGISMDALREIKFLSELSHPNIIKLHAVFSTKDQNISLVLEHLPLGDVEVLFRESSIVYGTADIKAWANMLCQAIWFCHENFILHRDIKSNNLLIAADGTIKLADFGLARSFADPGRPMTSNVITRWYRPPELLYGCHHYGGAVDMWSVGCVIAELALRRFFLQSDTDIQQLAVICDVFGTPTEETWPGVSLLRYYVPPDKQPSGNTHAPVGALAAKLPQPSSWWTSQFALLREDGVDLLRGIMAMDPRKRLTAAQALRHPWWTNAPRPTRKENLPRKGGGEKKMGEDLKRKGLETPGGGRADKVARKLNFG